MNPPLLAIVRLAVAAVWIYEGLWLKVVRPAPHELAVAQSVTLGLLSPITLLRVIGGGETLLGLGVLSGRYPRFLAWFQGLVLVLMNVLGILFAGSAIPDPVGLVIHNLPLLACIIVLGAGGSTSAARPRGGGKR